MVLTGLQHWMASWRGVAEPALRTGWEGAGSRENHLKPGDWVAQSLAAPRGRLFPPPRCEKQLEQEEQALQQQRRRLYAEVAEEKERLSQQAAR